MARLSLLVVPTVLAACGSVYDTHQAAPSAWVATYNEPSGGTGAVGDGDGSAERHHTTDASPEDAEGRLREAKQLRDDGLILEKEYQELRKRILGSL